MIQKEEVQRGKLNAGLVKLTITGKIDDILLQKSPVKLENIFNYGQKIVLIEGAPGSGKSTLALHICQEWGEGKLFQEFDITILVRLRDPLIKEAKTISDILPCTNKAMANEKETEIMSLYGKGILWVLDGWDELPSDLPQDSIINKLIRPGMSRESPLHESTVIVTSRPSSSAELHPLVSSRVEVLGFTPHQLEQYFTDCLNGDSQAVETLLNRIRENPVVEGSCYLPLNASVVVHCFLCDNHSLPTSNHGIFKSLVQNSLKRYLQDKLGKTTPVGNITSPDSLPSELHTPFIQMCQLAYHGIDTNKVTFTLEDFTTLSITEDISGIGLIKSVPSILCDDQLVYYCFLHLSIQELLAAIHISLMSPEDQISIFKKLFGNPRFSTVFQFYAGITKLKTKILNKQTLNINPNSILDFVMMIVQSECRKWYLESKPLLLSLMHCLYEAEDLSLCSFMADLLDHKLYLRKTMHPIDCLSVGYVASLTTKPFLLSIVNCSIGDQGCKFLARGLSKCPHSQCKLTLWLNDNQIHEQGVRHIAELLKNTTLLSSLGLNSNKIDNSGLNTLCEALSTNTSLTHLYLNTCSLTLNDHGAIPRLLKRNTTLQYLDLSKNRIGNTELSNLCDALLTNTSLTSLNLSDCSIDICDPIFQLLKTNTTLQSLYFSSNNIDSTKLISFCDAISINISLKALYLGFCSLEISEDNGAALYKLLSENNSLEELNLSGNKVTSCHHIAAGLAVNKTLRRLELTFCHLTNRSIEELSTGLINNIEELNIFGNESITMDGIKTLARHLTSNCPKLNTLYLPGDLSSIVTVFKATNEERRKNSLTDVNVADFSFPF